MDGRCPTEPVLGVFPIKTAASARARARGLAATRITPVHSGETNVADGDLQRINVAPGFEPQAAERERDHGLMQPGGRADVAPPLIEAHCGIEPTR